MNRSLNEATNVLGTITALHPEARERLRIQAQRLGYLRSSVALELLEMLVGMEQTATTELDAQIHARKVIIKASPTASTGEVAAAVSSCRWPKPVRHELTTAGDHLQWR